MFPAPHFTKPPLSSQQKHQSGILPEKLAIILCGLLIAVFALPILVMIHVISALFWGIITVAQLLRGKELCNEENELWLIGNG